MAIEVDRIAERGMHPRDDKRRLGLGRDRIE